MKYSLRRLLLTTTITVLAQLSLAQVYVASTGAVDEGSINSFVFNSGTLSIRPSLPAASAIVRYNVLPVGELLKPLSDPCCAARALVVRYIDNGPGAQVKVTLKRYNVRTGGQSILLTFDSNDFPSASGYQQHIPTIFEGRFFDFNFAQGPFDGGEDQGGDAVYFLEATLIKSSSAGTPAIASIRIITTQAN
jgi:hypothetical protein